MRQGNQIRYRLTQSRLLPGLAAIFALALVVALAACDGGTESSVKETGGQESNAQAKNDAPDELGTQVTHTGREDESSSAASAAPAPAATPVTVLSPGEVSAALEAAMIGVYQKALPSVVHILVVSVSGGEANQDIPGLLPAPEFFRRGAGSGFVWDDEGHVVTNYHVVEGAESVTVSFADGTQVEATVVGGDPDSDLAVLKLDEDVESAAAIELGDSSLVQVGQTAIAIGAPFGQEFTMSSGIVSGVGRTIRSGGSGFSVPEVIQTDAPLNPGNSGGPLLDRLGRVIGINTQILTRNGSNAGVGLAVPVNTARRVIPDLIEDGEYEHSWLGIRGQDVFLELVELMDLPGDAKGVYVVQVQYGSPADKSGLRGSDGEETVDDVEVPAGGDIIVKIDGQPVLGITDLIAYLSSSTRPGDAVTLEVIRDGNEIELEVTLGKRP